MTNKIVNVANNFSTSEAHGDYTVQELAGVTLADVKKPQYLYMRKLELRPMAKVRVYGHNFSFYCDLVVTCMRLEKGEIETIVTSEKEFHKTEVPETEPALEVCQGTSDQKWFIYNTATDEPLNGDKFNTKAQATKSLKELEIE